MSEHTDLASTIFNNDEGELRSGWRVLAFVAAFLIFSSTLFLLLAVLGTLVPAVDSLIPRREPGASGTHRIVGSLLTVVITLVAALAASLLCARLLERRSLSSIGFKLHSGWLRDLMLGLILGVATLAIAVGIIAAAGAVSLEVQTGEVLRLTSGFTALILFFLLAAAFEEILIRGFAFQAIAHNIGPVAAIAITSVAFSLIHIQNPSLNLFSMFNTLLAGVWLGVAYWMTRSLWLATALHASWNFAMVWIFGLPVSGLTTFADIAWLRGTPGEPVWMSGGAYGPEGGAAATAAILLSTLAIWKGGLFRPSPDMLAALQHGSSALNPDSVPKASEREESA